MICIYFFFLWYLANKWVCLCHCVSELAYCRLQTIGNISSLHPTQILDTNRYISYKLIFITFSSSLKFYNIAFLQWEILCKVWSCKLQKQGPSVVANHLKSGFGTVNWMAESEEIRNCVKYTSDKRDKLDWNLQTPFFRFRVTVRPKGQGGRCGGFVVSALSNGSSGPCLSPCQGHCVVFLGIHFTLTVPLSTKVYKWVPLNLMLGVTLH